MPNMVDNERTTPTVQPAGADGNVAPKRDLRFWMCLTSLMISSFIIALDLVRLSRFLSISLLTSGFAERSVDGSPCDIARFRRNAVRMDRLSVCPRGDGIPSLEWRLGAGELN